MGQAFHKTFSSGLIGADGFDATSATNGTIAQSAGAGLNGTIGGVTCTRTANSPSLYGYADASFAGATHLRTAWYTDLSNLTIGTNGERTVLMRAYIPGVQITGLVWVYKVAEGLRFSLSLYNDSAVPTSLNEALSLPAWMELRMVRASGVGVNDGAAQLYAGGGTYPALGELIIEVTGVPNYTRFAQQSRLLAGMFNEFSQGSSVGGSLKFDEWVLRDDDTPILFGVGPASVSSARTMPVEVLAQHVASRSGAHESTAHLTAVRPVLYEAGGRLAVERAVPVDGRPFDLPLDVPLEGLVRVLCMRQIPYEARQGFVIQTVLKIVEADMVFADEERDCLFTTRMA